MRLRVGLITFLLLSLGACSNGLFGQKEALEAEQQARRQAEVEMERKADQQRARMDLLEGEIGQLRRELGLLRSDITDMAMRLAPDLEAPAPEESFKTTQPVEIVPVEQKPERQEQPLSTEAGPVSSGPVQYGLHLSSYRNPDKAADGWTELRAKYPDLLAGRAARISILDMGSFGGVYYRLKAGPIADKNAADDLCRQFQAAGEYCVVAEFTGDPLN